MSKDRKECGCDLDATCTCCDLPDTETCIDCKLLISTEVTYWGGGPRCEPCTNAFRDQVIAKRQAELDAARERQKRHVCGQEIEDAEDTCPECCDHFDVCEDELVCLDCGEDMREQYMSLAYDRAKDYRKYGDS